MAAGGPIKQKNRIGGPMKHYECMHNPIELIGVENLMVQTGKKQS